MAGSATLTIEKSGTTMNRAAHNNASDRRPPTTLLKKPPSFATNPLQSVSFEDTALSNGGFAA